METKIQVEDKHIKAGRRGLNHICPIALAVTEQTKKKNVKVLIDEILWGDIGIHEEGVSMPKKCSNFIDKFDAGRKVKPFSFVINI